MRCLFIPLLKLGSSRRLLAIMSDWEEALRQTKPFSIEGVSGYVNTYDTYAEKQRVQAGKTRLVQKSNRNFLHNLI